MALIKCSECGAEISEKASECPKCGCPIEISIESNEVEKKKKKKNNIKKIMAIIVFILVIILLLVLLNQPDKSGYYNGLKWGMDYDKVAEELGDDALTDDEKKIISFNQNEYGGREGISTLESYKFEEQKLYQIVIFVSNSDDSNYTDKRLMTEIIDEMEALYGEGTEESSYLYTWKTEKSNVQFLYLGEKVFCITYEDITYSEVEGEDI